MKITDYIQYDGLGLAELIKQREVTAHEVLEAAITMCELVNPAINAVVQTFYDKAHQQLKDNSTSGLFQGVPLLIKDLGFAYQDTIETCGSRYFFTHVSDYTSDFVNQLLSNGYIIFGKTNTPELGLSFTTEPSLFGPCHNPWDLARSSGGSSGGSAAAVAARIVPIATANDGGGSIRVPAACCGLFGLKPSRYSTPCGPKVSELWSGLATNHVLTRSVRDSAATLDMMCNPLRTTISLLSTYQLPPQPLKIALLTGVFHDVPIAKECQDALMHANTLLQDLGHTVEVVKLNLNLERIDNSILTIIASNTRAELEEYRSKTNEDYHDHNIEPITKHFADLANQFNASDLIRAKQILHQETHAVVELHHQYDILLTHALAKLPVHLGELNSHDEFEPFMQKNLEFSPFTSLFNQTGQPAMTIPVYWTPDGLPVSVQLAAAHGNELTLLRLAAQIEKAQPWINRLPNIVLNKK